MKKINTKINILLLSAVLLMGILLTLIIVPREVRMMKTQMENQTMSLAKTQISGLENETQSSVDGLSIMSKATNLSNKTQAVSIFQAIKNTDPQLVSTSLLDANGLDLTTDTKDKNDGLFTNGVQKGIFIGAIQNTVGANFTIPMAHSIMDKKGHVSGVIENQLSVSYLWLKLRGILDPSKVKPNPDQSIFLVSKAGYIVASDTMKDVQAQLQKNNTMKKGMVGSPAFQQMSQEIQQTHNLKPVSGFGKFKDPNGSAYYMTYAYSPDLQAAVFVRTSNHVIMAPIYQMIAIIIGLILASILIIAILGALFSRRLTAPIHQLVELTKRVSNGDLTHKLTLPRSDELGTLTTAFNQMIDHLRTLVSRSQEASKETVEVSQFLHAQALEISHASEEVVASMNAMATGAEQQAHLSHETETAITDFLKRSEQIDQKNNDVLSQAQETQSILLHNQDRLDALIQGFQKLATSTRASKETVEALRDTAHQISSIIKETNGFAEQTNLLALNAAIEAARAGEAGKGFSVVAQEIRKLSVASQTSATGIQKIIQSVLSSIDHACAQMEGTIELGTEGQSHANLAAAALPVIHQSMHQVIETVQELERDFNHQKTVLQEIHQNAKEASYVATNTSSGIEEVAASSEQTNDTMQTIVERVDQLKASAQSMQKTVQEFQIVEA